MTNTQTTTTHPDCGTQRGFTLHVIKGEVACQPCRQASIAQAALFFGMDAGDMLKALSRKDDKNL